MELHIYTPPACIRSLPVQLLTITAAFGVLEIAVFLLYGVSPGVITLGYLAAMALLSIGVASKRLSLSPEAIHYKDHRGSRSIRYDEVSKLEMTWRRFRLHGPDRTFIDLRGPFVGGGHMLSALVGQLKAANPYLEIDRPRLSKMFASFVAYDQRIARIPAFFKAGSWVVLTFALSGFGVLSIVASVPVFWPIYTGILIVFGLEGVYVSLLRRELDATRLVVPARDLQLERRVNAVATVLWLALNILLVL